MCRKGIDASLIVMTVTEQTPPKQATGRGPVGFTGLLAKYPRRSLAGVLFALVLAGIVGGPVAGALNGDAGFADPSAESSLALEEIGRATGEAPNAGIVLLVSPERVATLGARVSEVGEHLGTIPGVARVVSIDESHSPAVISQDGSSALVLGTLDADANEEEVGTDVIEAFESDPDVTVGGEAASGLAVDAAVSEDLGRAEMLAFPVLIALSLLFFRGRGAVLPLLVGGATVLGTFTVLRAVNVVYDLNIFALNLVIGLGLGLAIDYTLFMITRYREELASRGPGPEAIAMTMRTAGRTVVFSAVTVAAALASLTLFPLGFLKSMGIAGAVVAVVAAVATLVVSPVIFGLWGHRLGRSDKSSPQRESRWYSVARAVLARPGAVAAGAALLMLALALPAATAPWTPIDGTAVPKGEPARAVTDAVAHDFGGQGGPR